MKLYDVQTKALELSENQKCYGFFLEQGLGKTLVALLDYKRLLKDNPDLCAVVVCPNSLKINWKEEAAAWDSPIPVTVWPNKVAEPFILAINYEAVISGKGSDYLERLFEKHSIMLIIDESIHIKNPKAKRTKHLLWYARKAKYIRLLSGAPIVNNPMDIWAQLFILDGRVNSNPFAFRNKYCVMGGFRGKQIVNTRNEDTLTEIINEVGFIAKKKDWTDLPDKLYTQRRYELGPTIIHHYNQMKNHLVTGVGEDVITADMVLVQMGKLQQISSGFIINEEGKVIDLIPYGKNPKINAMLEIIEEIPSKIIIFCRFKQSIKNIIDALGNKTILYSALVGGMKQDEIADSKRAFNEGNVRIMVCQTASAMYGHTLLGTGELPCHNTIFYENDYNLNARIQAEDRNHRIGQHYPVTYHDLIGSPMDQSAITALKNKKSVSEAIIKDIKGGLI